MKFSSAPEQTIFFGNEDKNAEASEEVPANEFTENNHKETEKISCQPVFQHRPPSALFAIHGSKASRRPSVQCLTHEAGF